MILRLNAWPFCYSSVAFQFMNRSYSVSADAFKKYDEIKLYLQQKNVEMFDGWACFQCPAFFIDKLSTHTRTFKTHQLQNCFVNKTTGDFTCPSSGHHGTWKAFRKLHQEFLDGADSFHVDALLKMQNKSEVKDMWKMSKPLKELNFEDLQFLLEKYHLNLSNKIDLQAFNKYDVRCKEDTNELVIPYYDCTGKSDLPQGLKVINDFDYVNEECSKSLLSFTLISNADSFDFFGLDKFDFSKKKVVITANEFDAIAINSFSKIYSAISLPFGITSLPLRLLPFVERFSEIILWFGNDLLSIEAMQSFTKKFGESRCRIVRPSSHASTARATVKKNLNVDDIIASAVSLNIKNVLTFTDLYSEIKDEIFNKEKYSGIPFKRFWNVNNKIKGHRLGELTVLTGPTGSGKTTLLSEMSLDLAMQGVRTLWGSFEVKNKRLLTCMLKQYSQVQLESNLDMFDEVWKKFQLLPIIFMTYNGPSEIQNVIRTMFDATYCHDVQHIIIDNLQFMMGINQNADRFAYQDFVISQFRQFASKNNVHITLVIHPRKEDQYMPLQLSSVFGSAKATQEADNVLILQVTQRDSQSNYPKVTKHLEIAKNRYDGALGRAKLYFNPQTLCMSPPFEDGYKSSESNPLKDKKYKTDIANNLGSSKTVAKPSNINNVDNSMPVLKTEDCHNDENGSQAWIERFK